MQLGTDNFSRIVASGPGTSSDGQVWVVNAGTTANYSVSTNQLHYAYDSLTYGKLLLGTGVSQDFNFLARFTPGSNSDLFGFFFRYVTANDNIAAGINQTGHYYVTAFSGGTEFDYSSGGTVSVTAGTAAWVRVAVTGTQVQIRYWLDGTTEPSLWGYTVSISPAAWYGQYGLIERVGTAATSILTDSFTATNNTTTNLSTLGGYIFPASTDAMTNITTLTPLNIIRPEYWYVGNGHLGTAGVLIEETVAFEVFNGGSWGPAGASSTNFATVKTHSNQQFITVSGAEWPDGSRTAISSLANNSTLLGNFCNTLTTFCTQNGFTGIDLDMELHGGWSTTASATTWTQLKTIITQLGNSLHAAGLKLMVDGPTLTAQGSIKWNWSDLNNLPVDYFNVQAYDHFFDTLTGSSTSPGPDYAMAPSVWMAQVIAFMKTQITNINQLVVAVTSEAYYINNDDTTFGSVSENVGAFGFSDASGWTGFSGAIREKTSGEMMWSTGGKTYVYTDQVTINEKIMVCLDNGISNIAIFYIGSSNKWPTILPGGAGSGGGGGGGSTGGTTVNVTITNAGLNLIRDALIKGTISSLVTYGAIGTGTTAPAVTDTSLANEVFRKRIAGYSAGANVGEAIITMFMSQADAININVQEFGFFGGAASLIANSGTLIARGLYNHTHTNSETLTFSLDITI